MTLTFQLSGKGEQKTIQVLITDPAFCKTYVFNTLLRIFEEDWDPEKQRPLNIYKKKHKKLNKILNTIRIFLADHFAETEEKPKQILNQKSLSRKIQQLCTEEPSPFDKGSLLRSMMEYITAKKETVCHSTHKRYMVFYHMIELYEGETMKMLAVETTGSEFAGDFIRFGKKEQYSANTISRTIHFVKTILNYSERKGIRTRVREIEIRREKQKREIITISEDEINSIRKCKVPDELMAAKTWLLISCYTGQRVSDFMQFSREKLTEIKGMPCLSFVQKKTSKEITLPLHPTVTELLRNNGGEFPAPLPASLYNIRIREVARLAGLCHPIRARKRIGHRARTILTEKWQMLTSHIGRRSFATNFYGKIPTPLLMEATGHSTERVFKTYINPNDNERIITLGNYFNKMHGITTVAEQ